MDGDGAMRDLAATAFTEAVVARFAWTADPRLRAVMAAVVRHLHALVREVAPTPAEWSAAIGFLARAGQACGGRRQEFALLSDVLGVSALVGALNRQPEEGATEAAPPGPFQVADPPGLPNDADIAAGQAGERLRVEGLVTSTDGRPLAGACVDVWQCDEDGYYDVQRPELGRAHLRGRFRTDGGGRFSLWSVMPSYYPIPMDGPVGALMNATGRHPFRPAHVHFRIAAEGHETLVTQVFPAGGPYLDSDASFFVRPSLVAEAPRVEGTVPDGSRMAWRRLAYRFALAPSSPAGR